MNVHCVPTSGVGPYKVQHYPRSPRICVLYGWSESDKRSRDTVLERTPANTLVISSTLIPASGRLDASGFDVGVASPRRSPVCQLYAGRCNEARKMLLEPLGTMLDRTAMNNKRKWCRDGDKTPTIDDRDRLRHFRGSSLAATPPIIDRSFYLYRSQRHHVYRPRRNHRQ
jgi:hypothetical protein